MMVTSLALSNRCSASLTLVSLDVPIPSLSHILQAAELHASPDVGAIGYVPDAHGGGLFANQHDGFEVELLALPDAAAHS